MAPEAIARFLSLKKWISRLRPRNAFRVVWITPGSVADLMKVDRANYGDNIQGYKDALCFLIQQNQSQHPPPGGVGFKEGIDYWTTLYFFTHQDMDRMLETSNTRQNMQKGVEMAPTAASTPGVVQAMLSTDVEEGPPALTDKEQDKEKKAAQKAKQAEVKKLKLAQKSWSAVVNLMAKCRSITLHEDLDKKFWSALNKHEKELAGLQPKEGQELEDLEMKMESIAGINSKLHALFPSLAPKEGKPSKLPKTGEARAAAAASADDAGAAADAQALADAGQAAENGAQASLEKGKADEEAESDGGNVILQLQPEG